MENLSFRTQPVLSSQECHPGSGGGPPGLGTQLGSDGHPPLCFSPRWFYPELFRAAQVNIQMCSSRTMVTSFALEVLGLKRLLLLPAVLSSVFRMELLPQIVMGTPVLVFILKLSSVAFCEFSKLAYIAWPRGTGFIKAFASLSSTC